jgi:hypothetical protein
MPRIRSVHPAIVEDDVLASVSAYAERTFVRLWTVLDDEGRAKDNPRLLAAQLYPLHDRVDVERDLAELAAAGLLQRYEVDGRRYLCAKPEAWARYQKPRRKVASNLPPSPSPDNVGTRTDVVDRGPAGGGVGGEGSRRQEGESEGEAPAPARDPLPVDNRSPWMTPGPQHSVTPRLVSAAEMEARAAAHAASARRRDPA